MTFYRWTIAPTHTRHGEWRDTRAEAVQDAIAEKLAFTDEVRPGVILWHPLAAIEESDLIQTQK